ncbi:beta-1,3-galactosyltransferase 5-like [Littorina saxatilis]|uniref:beta-1,3-galactosyltransferase 5-like n=1 Tax=Littorina saxatilis TaxID=31220 RepID=UPI0038B4D2B4
MRLTWRHRPRVGQQAVLVTLVLLSLTFVLLAAVRFTPIPPMSSSCYADPLSREADPKQVELYFKPRPAPVNDVVSTFLLQPHAGMCQGPLDLLVLVPCPPDAVAVRDTIRQTWGSVVKTQWPHSTSRRRVGLVFVLGVQAGEGEKGKGKGSDVMRVLRKEGAQHGDLLVGDFLDSYRNLTRKILAGFNWVSKHCSSFSASSSSSYHPFRGDLHGASPAFVLKADADSFVNVDRLLDVLSEVKLTQSVSNTLMGEVLCSEPANRDPESRVRVDPSLYPFSAYPPYTRGGTYVLPGALLPRLVNASRYLPHLPVEDAFINGVVARSLDVEHMHLPGVMRGMVCGVSPCSFLALDQLTAISVDPAMMKDIWKAVKAGPDHCQLTSSLWTRACVWVSRHWG